MSFTRNGSCNRCGECCTAAEVHQKMRQNANVVSGTEYCDFFYFNAEELGVCKIIKRVLQYLNEAELGRNFDSIERIEITDAIRDYIRNNENITGEQARWFVRECLQFPDANDDAHLPGRFDIAARLPNCGFEIVGST